MTPTTGNRLLYSGPFGADHRDRVRSAVCERADAGGRDILYIVASPAARRAAVDEILARRSAVFGFRVCTLGSLAREVARRARTKEPKPVDAEIDSLLVERAVRIASGARFDGSTPMPGLAAKAASTIDQLERNGATSHELREVLERVQHPASARILLDAWATLETSRRQYGPTPTQLLLATTALVRERPALLGTLDLLVIEDAPLVTAAEREAIAALIDAAPGDVLAAHGYAPQLADAPSTQSLRHLREMTAWQEHTCFLAAERRSGFTARLFATAPGFADAREQPFDPPGVRLTRLEATGDLGEVRLAARVVRRHLDAGVHPHEIALVVHSGFERYRELVDEVFTAAGIRVSAPVQRTLADTGIGGTILRLVELVLVPKGMTRQASLALARSPHLGLRTRDADTLEQRVTVKGYLGLDGWDAVALETLGPQAANRVNRLKRAVAGARKRFESITTARDAAGVVRHLARELRLVNNAYVARQRRLRGSVEDATLQQKAASAVREDNVAWEAIDDVLATTVPALLDIERAPASKRGLALAEAWLAMFTRVMRSRTVHADHPPAGAVQLRGTGPGSDAPTRVTIVLGLLEKSFPRQPRQDPFLDDDVRRALRTEHGWSLVTSDEMVTRERESFLRAVSSATEALYLSCAATDAEGRPSVRSFFIDDVEKAVGASIRAERTGAATAIPPLGDAASPAELLAAVSHEIWQHLPAQESASRRAAAFRALEAIAGRERDLASVRHGRRVPQRPVLDPALLAEAPHRTLRLSASQLEMLSHCTYRHFVTKVLDPTALVAPDYDALRKGKLIHDAIMAWSTTLRGWERGTEALGDLDAWVRQRVLSSSAAERGSARALAAIDGDCKRLRDFLSDELALLARPGVAQPRYAELAFGEERSDRGPRDSSSRLDPFTLEVETVSHGLVKVELRGSMDRVDVFEVGGKRYGVVIDYKTGATSKRYAENMMDGHDLQLRSYLLVLKQMWDIEPVGALYLGFGDGVRRGAVHGDFANRVAGLQDDAVTAFGAADWAGFVAETPRLITPLVERLISLDIVPAPRNHDCGYCDLASICRYQRWAPEVAGV